MKLTSLLTLALILLSSSFVAQVPQNGLVEIFDGLDVPFGGPVGNVTLAEDRFGLNCALEFDGSMNTMLLVQNAPQFDFDEGDDLSISLWYRGGSDEAGDLENLFIKYGESDLPWTDPVYGLQLYDLNTPLMSSDPAYLWADQSNIVFPGDTNWHHLVGVFEAGHWKLYLDNALSSEAEQAEMEVQSAVSDIAIGQGFEGRMDDIHLYNRALSSEEVTQLFLASNMCAVGLEELVSLPSLDLYPNPAQEQLSFSNNTQGAVRVVVIDLSGAVVLDEPLSGHTIDISSLAKGSYIVELWNETKLGQGRFQKN